MCRGGVVLVRVVGCSCWAGWGERGGRQALPAPAGREARARGGVGSGVVFDVLLYNESGEVTETSIANVALEQRGGAGALSDLCGDEGHATRGATVSAVS